MDQPAPPAFTFHLPPTDLGSPASAPGGPGLARGADETGLWSLRPSPAAGLPFALGAPAPEAPTWRVSLPGDPFLARTVIAAGETSVAAAGERLADASARLVHLLRRAATEAQQPPSFAFGGPMAPQAAPEAGLWRLLQADRGLHVSFGRAEELAGRWEPAGRDLEAFLQRLRVSLTHYARVETAVDGETLARTIVRWSGDVDTLWQEGGSRAHAALHHRTLAIAMATRAIWIRLYATLAGGSARLAALLTNPVTLPLALPAAWRFVQDVLAGAGELRAVAS